MDKKTDSINWLQNLAAFAILVALSFAFILINDKTSETASNWDLLLQVIPDLIAALFIALIIYFFLVRKGISPQEQLVEKIVESLKSEIGGNSFGNPREVSDRFDIRSKLKTAKEILICGYSCRYLIGELRPEIVQALINKVNIKIIVIEPNSAASKLLQANQVMQEIEPDLAILNEMIKTIRDDVYNKINKKAGQIQIRYMDWLPSCSMLFYIPKNEKYGVLRLKVYAPSNRSSLPKIITHMLIEEKKETELYQYFLTEFYKLWDNSTDGQNQRPN